MKKIFNLVFINETNKEEYKHILEEQFAGRYSILYEVEYMMLCHMGIEVDFANNFILLNKFLKISNDINDRKWTIASIQHASTIDSDKKSPNAYISTRGTNIIFCDIESNFVLKPNFNMFANTPINEISRGSYDSEVLFVGTMWINQKIYAANSLGVSRRANKTVKRMYYLTELQDNFNPVFNIFKKNKNFVERKNRSSGLISTCEDILSKNYKIGFNKDIMLELWIMGSSFIKKEDKGTLLACLHMARNGAPNLNATPLGNFINKIIVDSFDYIFDAEHSSLEQLRAFITEAREDDFVFITNIPLMHNLYKNTNMLNQAGTSSYWGSGITFKILSKYLEQNNNLILSSYDEYKDGNMGYLSNRILEKLCTDWNIKRFDARVLIDENSLILMKNYLF